MEPNKKDEILNDENKSTVFGNPEYAAKDDIYGNEKKVPFKENEEDGLAENESNETISDDVDLDIPGTELDDPDERIGEEDEENNYYSLGGDNHNDLEESQDD